MENPVYKAALASEPDIVVILLGMNDSKKGNFDKAMFETDYKKMISDFQALNSKPLIFPCIPTPLYFENFTMQKSAIQVMKTLVKDIALSMSIPQEQVVDLYHPFGGDHLTKPFLFFDGAHCNENGYLYIAQVVLRALQTVLKKPKMYSYQNL